MALVMRARKTRANEVNTEAGVVQALLAGLPERAGVTTESVVSAASVNRVYLLDEDVVVRASIAFPAEEAVRWVTGRLRWERRLEQLFSE